MVLPLFLNKTCNPCCCCCCCFHTAFIFTQPGICKIAEMILNMVCQTLLITYGNGVSFLLGSTLSSFLTTTSIIMFTTILLFVCYVLSESSYYCVRKSILEVLFNTVACVMILSEAGWLLFKTIVILWPIYIVIPFFTAFPAMMATSVMGLLLAVLHGLDAYYAFQARS